MTANLFMLVGLPGSGKSSYAEELANEHDAVIHSSDKIREELFGDINCQNKNDVVFTTLNRRVKEDLKSGRTVIYDACNIASKRRMAFLRELKNIRCNKKCIVIARPYEECLIADRDRDRTVGEKVIKQMYMNWQPPHPFEGWDYIEIKYNCSNDKFKTPEEKVLEFITFNQDNPHHTLYLTSHLIRARNIAVNSNYPDVVQMAAYLHDIGKPFTKTFKNRKGELCDIAHYYQHHSVSAYDSMFLLNMNNGIEFSKYDILTIFAIIAYHMMPYQWEKDVKNGEKLRNKYKEKWGDDLYEKVMQMHLCDLAAH